MRTRRGLLAAVLSLATLTQALGAGAQGRDEPQGGGARVNTQGRTTEYIFTDQLVQAGNARPDQTTVRRVTPGQRPSLLRIRTHFVPEMLTAVERL